MSRRPNLGSATGELAQAVGLPYEVGKAGQGVHVLRQVYHPLGLIGWWCQEHHLPCLNCLVVEKSGNKYGDCGESAVVRPGLTPAKERDLSRLIRWDRVTPPSRDELGRIDSAHGAEHKKVN